MSCRCWPVGSDVMWESDIKPALWCSCWFGWLTGVGWCQVDVGWWRVVSCGCWLVESDVMLMLIGGEWCYVESDIVPALWYSWWLVGWLVWSDVKWMLIDGSSLVESYVMWMLIGGEWCYVDAGWLGDVRIWLVDAIKWNLISGLCCVLQSDWWLVIDGGIWLAGGNARWSAEKCSPISTDVPMYGETASLLWTWV